WRLFFNPISPVSFGCLGVSPTLPFPANFPWPALYLGNEFRTAQSDRISLLTAVLAIPLQVGVLLLVLRRSSNTRLYQLGLTGRRFVRNFLAGILGWFTLTPFVYLILLVVNLAWLRWVHL